MCKAILFDRVAEGLDDMVLTQYVIECLWAILSREYLITHKVRLLMNSEMPMEKWPRSRIFHVWLKNKKGAEICAFWLIGIPVALAEVFADEFSMILSRQLDRSE